MDGYDNHTWIWREKGFKLYIWQLQVGFVKTLHFVSIAYPWTWSSQKLYQANLATYLISVDRQTLMWTPDKASEEKSVLFFVQCRLQSCIKSRPKVYIPCLNSGNHISLLHSALSHISTQFSTWSLDDKCHWNVQCSGDGPAGIVKGGLIPWILGDMEGDIITAFYIDCQFPPYTVVQHHIVT